MAKIKKAGFKPFIMPAMGSHGGATSEGQIEILRARGITEHIVGAPVRASMDVKLIGEVDGIPLFISRLAYEAESIVLINRIKPHTNFIGPTERQRGFDIVLLINGCMHACLDEKHPGETGSSQFISVKGEMVDSQYVKEDHIPEILIEKIADAIDSASH